MRKYLIAGNWKMNGSKASITELLTKIKTGLPNNPNVTWAVFPPFPFLETTAQLLLKSPILLGAQNISDKTSGAFTGEVSACMLHEFDCTYVLIGHSERRQYYGENDAIIAAKFATTSKAGLTPILCIGETLQEREQNLTTQVIKQQLHNILTNTELLAMLEHAVIAYEPVWAIGTGMTATPEQAQEVHAFIRKEIEVYNQPLAKKITILYGGSVKADNAQKLFAMPDIDGGLIGGASLNAEDFLAIGKSCNY